MIPSLVPQLTGDAGLMRRFSITSWGSGASATTESSTDSVELTTKATSEAKSSGDAAAQPLAPQTTGSLWSSWWSSSGGDAPASPTKLKSASAQAKDAKTPAWYVAGIQARKAGDTKLAKHLISLRVHLSTAKLSWVQDFLREAAGMDALGALLAEIVGVGKGGKRAAVGEVEESVVYEAVKCLRVLLNTEVS